MVVCMPVAFLENLNLLTIEKTIVLKNLTLFRTSVDYATYNKYFKRDNNQKAKKSDKSLAFNTCNYQTT